MNDLNVAKSIYPNIKIRNFDESKYNKINENLKNKIPSANGSYSKFEVFSLSEYDGIVFLDSDILVLRDLEYLFHLDCDFGACRELLIDQFNSGVMVINKRFLIPDYIDKLIYVTERGGPKEHADQDVINDFFRPFITEIPIYYNFLKTYYNYPFLQKYPMPEHIKTLHYIINKPWIQKTGMRQIEIATEELDKLWWNVYNSIKK